jgi:hypothetical protein
MTVPGCRPFTALEPIVARIPDELLDCIVYLYPSVDEAERGATSSDPGQGGTGFLVDVPVEDAPHPDLRARYIVTNSHVVGPEGQSPVVRVNTADGRFDVLPLTRDNWMHHPDADDVAVTPIGLSAAVHKFKTVDWTTWALTQQELDEWQVGPGDQVFFLGRFRHQEGRGRNVPTVRQGNIARMPREERITHPRGFEQESFLIEARSLSGYSGSPVFLYIPPYDWRGQLHGTGTDVRHVALLGIDWGHQPDLARVLGPDQETPWSEAELWVKQNSGLMNVVPAWRINSFLLEDEDLKKQRQVALQKWSQRQRESGTAG